MGWEGSPSARSQAGSQNYYLSSSSDFIAPQQATARRRRRRWRVGWMKGERGFSKCLKFYTQTPETERGSEEERKRGEEDI